MPPRATRYGERVDIPSLDIDSLKFDADGLLPAIAQDADTGEVLMLAWVSAESLRASVASGRATYWSRSRQELWVKGDTSGHTQELLEVRVDCDADAVLLRVRQVGPACHTGKRSCFDTAILWERA